MSVFLHNLWGHLRSVSLHTTLGPPAHILRLLYGGPSQISFIACYRGGHLRSVSSQNIWGPLSDQFLRLLYGVPLRL